MDKYWRTRPSMIARMHTIAKLPRELKGRVSLRPEDHLLLISGDKVGFHNESTVKLSSRKMKKDYTAALFFSENDFQITSNIEHKFPGEHETKHAEIHYTVSVDRTSSYLLREGLISNYSGMNIIDVVSLSEVINGEMAPRKDEIFGRLDSEMVRDTASITKMQKSVADFLRITLAKFGMSLNGEVNIRWSETSSEALESFKSARLAEIEANEELMKLEEESNLSAVTLEAQAIAQKKLKRSRRHLAKKEREFLQNQLETQHQFKVESLELEKETFRMKKNHELDVLRAKMQNELSELELERIVNERFADEEKRIALESERISANFDHREREMELIFEQQRMELELDKEKAENIENKRILSDFDREESVKSAIAEAEIDAIKNQAKLEQLKGLIELKEMMKANKESRQQTSDKSPSSGQKISGNIIGGNLNVNLSGKVTAPKQEISDNVITGDVSVESDTEED